MAKQQRTEGKRQAERFAVDYRRELPEHLVELAIDVARELKRLAAEERREAA